MDAFTLAQLTAEHARADRPYREFLRAPSCSVGLYRLPAGAVDPQRPHTEDEIYYVVGGRGRLRVGDEDREVAAGAVVFVAARVDHRFHTIAEDLTVLVFFAPAEYSRAIVVAESPAARQA